jgi:16S rRNA (guanine966-N2)-methyltransferase
VAIIQANLATLKLTERATLQGADALVALEAPAATFDLIVADPPYDDAALAEGIMARCAAPGGPLADEGLLALTGRTRPGDLPRALPEGLRCVRTLIYGDSCVDLLERTTAT